MKNRTCSRPQRVLIPMRAGRKMVIQVQYHMDVESSRTLITGVSTSGYDCLEDRYSTQPREVKGGKASWRRCSPR